jgi:protein tyrosine phosphatase (PTP) superfamily phosphohydrolase (DUF442 family)
MCLCGMSRAYPEFYITEEEMKKFVSKLKNATKCLLAYAFHGTREEQIWHYLN